MATVLYQRYCSPEPETYRTIGTALGISPQYARNLGGRGLYRLSGVMAYLEQQGVTKESRLWKAIHRSI